MKQVLTISLLLFSVALDAQTNNQVNPANSNPAVKISPSIKTTVTQQPASIPNSNTNPTTGTVISLKTKNASKDKSQKSKLDSSPVVNKTSTPSSNSQNKSARKRATKKNKIILKNEN
jgi:predicted secreted protein